MRRLSLVMVMILAFGMAMGQKNNRTTAFNYMRNGKLDKAKEFIDKTIEHPQTKEDARSWFYRGNIYLSIHMSENPEYKALENNALEIAFDSYTRAQEYDKTKEYYTDILTNLFVISEQFYNVGVIAYNESNFKDAMLAFQKSMQVTEMMGSRDTTAVYNVGLTAEMAGENAIAKKYYLELLGMGYQNPEIYSSMSRILMAESDTTAALAYIMDGRKKFPEDFSLLINEINIYLLTGNNEKAIENLEIATKKDNTNPTIFFAIGVAYDQLKVKHPEAPDFYFSKAESAYKRAVELDPMYFDPAYNLGALYVNSAALLIEEANKLPLSEQKKYDELTEKANLLLNKSLPNLEKALEVQPNDLNTMVSLKEIYTRLNKMENLQEINRRIQEYQKN